MSGKVILYVAMSLDGYLAKKNHAMDWLLGESAREDIDNGYAQFYDTIGTLLMGATTYREIIEHLSPDAWPYPDKPSYVFTSKAYPAQPDVHFIRNSPSQILHEIRKTSQQDIWLVGGARLIHTFMSKNLIDKYIISIIPTLLGEGILLFAQREEAEIKLSLIEQRSVDGIVELHYIPRKKPE
ncbi:dihydrofolate reductase family protein [Entomospira culicis]|uniref:Dihydrofolate reductase n=1 Tax=Entomospira culicis TaxID=2719989 RepID=A0A968KZ08_9SPIO|nr:dihydrofolate reductase family protein [Entomospira culicis]NIZ18626.1 dihydrofolate reductase [Entomospira culicis]NIZ68841.1 dihydrofolate reductase [Entomospira culicis]WDI37435.1 dihydrofolate reductase family protein [Entomospira culicis]WDI39063.1 dihydrofolate reductase family protein [Entomospira culicis]